MRAAGISRPDPYSNDSRSSDWRTSPVDPSAWSPVSFRLRLEHVFDSIRPDGSVEEVPPERCPAGHPLLPCGTLVGWSPCGCTPGQSGHRTYTCRFIVDGV